MPVDLSAVGKKLGSVTHTYTERDVILYALGVGAGVDELQFTYERDLKVLPTFAVVAQTVHRFEPPAVEFPGISIDLAKVLHGTQRIDVHDLVQAVVHRLFDHRMLGNLDRTGGVLVLTRDERGKDCSHHVVGLEALQGSGILASAFEAQHRERAIQIPPPSHREHR